LPLRAHTLVVNAEPCSMCASAIVKAGVGSLVYGAPHEPHMDPDLAVADVFARASNPPRVTAGLLADEAASQIASYRVAAEVPPVD
jgi:tRNA(Arg) A34 adenosine deaminase TadA